MLATEYELTKKKKLCQWICYKAPRNVNGIISQDRFEAKRSSPPSGYLINLQYLPLRCNMKIKIMDIKAHSKL